MKNLIIILILMVTGCNTGFLGTNDGARSIHFHVVDRQTLTDIATHDTLGYAEWDEFDCDIYLMEQKRYKNLDQYQCVMDHELRHCVDGDFHAGTWDTTCDASNF